MNLRRPDKALLRVWRLNLILAALVPGFLLGLLLPAGGRIWLLATLVWGLAFVLVYAFYLPLRFGSMAYGIEAGRLIFLSGVLKKKHTALPFENMQYVSVVSAPISRMLGVCSLRVVVPGGQLLLPGLRPQEAQTLCGLLLDAVGQPSKGGM